MHLKDVLAGPTCNPFVKRRPLLAVPQDPVCGIARGRRLMLAGAMLLSLVGQAWLSSPATAAHRRYSLPHVVKRLPVEDAGTVEIEPGNSRILVTEYPPAGLPGPPVREGLRVLDPRTYRTVAFFSYPGGSSNVAFYRSHAYVVVGKGKLLEIDTHTLRIVATRELGTGNVTQTIAINPRTGRLYVTVYEASVAVFDLKTLRRTGTLAVGSDSVVVDTARNEIWASDYSAGSVEVFSGRTGRRLHTINIGAHAIPANCSTNCKVIPAGTDGVAVDMATDTVYADNTNSSQIVVIDGRTYKPIHYYQGAEPGSFWPAVDERRTTAYSIEDQESSLSVLTGQKGALRGAVSVGVPEGPAGCDIFGYENTCTHGGSAPQGVAVNEETGYIYVGDSGDAAFVYSKIYLPPVAQGELVVLAPGHWVNSH